jgi:hypothetical protein
VLFSGITGLAAAPRRETQPFLARKKSIEDNLRFVHHDLSLAFREQSELTVSSGGVHMNTMW